MNWFLDPIQNHFADFSGRANRQQYWMFFVINLAITVVVYLVDSQITGGILYFLYLLALMVPNVAIGVRRLHDINKSGWTMLIGLIPILGTLYLIYLYAQPGDPHENQYGPVPISPAPATS